MKQLTKNSKHDDSNITGYNFLFIVLSKWMFDVITLIIFSFKSITQLFY